MAKIRAQAVRKAAKKLGVFSWDDLSVELKIPTYKDRQRMKTCVRDFRKRGEIVRREDGRLEYREFPRRRTKMDVIWHLVRSHRMFSTDAIERLSGASRDTVLEYLHCLKHLGYLRGGARGWLLIQDPGPETPTNAAKCRKLRDLRARKKAGGTP
ncbi:MAG: hypothetical protein PVG49_16725 [Desulfobacteraceae bacterium]|jgi:hypothetical protein